MVNKRSGCVNIDNNRGRLYALVGAPQSGKSTFCNEWIKQCPLQVDENGKLVVARPRTILGGDDMRFSLTGHEYLPHAEAHCFSVLDTAALALLNRGHDILIDDTSSSKATLLRYLRLDTNVELIILPTTIEECKRRAIENGRQYLIRVIDRIYPRVELLRQKWPEIRLELLKELEHRLSEDSTVEHRMTEKAVMR